jgi:hypothetical protein
LNLNPNISLTDNDISLYASTSDSQKLHER